MGLFSKKDKDTIIVKNNTLTINGLMYQNQPFIEKFTWEEAKEYAKNLQLEGHNDWRLPTKEELSKIINVSLFGNKNPNGEIHHIRKEFLHNISDGRSDFWTSEECSSTHAWYLSFKYASIDECFYCMNKKEYYNGDRVEIAYVMCVRWS